VGEKRDEKEEEIPSRYDIASRYLNRLAATRTHCVKLISIFGDGRERVKNLERVIRNSEAKLRRACEKKMPPNRTSGSDERRRFGEENERRPASKGRDIIEIIARDERKCIT